MPRLMDRPKRRPLPAPPVPPALPSPPGREALWQMIAEAKGKAPTVFPPPSLPPVPARLSFEGLPPLPGPPPVLTSIGDMPLPIPPPIPVTEPIIGPELPPPSLPAPRVPLQGAALDTLEAFRTFGPGEVAIGALAKIAPEKHAELQRLLAERRRGLPRIPETIDLPFLPPIPIPLYGGAPIQEPIGEIGGLVMMGPAALEWAPVAGAFNAGRACPRLRHAASGRASAPMWRAGPWAGPIVSWPTPGARRLPRSRSSSPGCRCRRVYGPSGWSRPGARR